MYGDFDLSPVTLGKEVMIIHLRFLMQFWGRSWCSFHQHIKRTVRTSEKLYEMANKLFFSFAFLHIQRLSHLASGRLKEVKNEFETGASRSMQEIVPIKLETVDHESVRHAMRRRLKHVNQKKEN